VVTVLPQTARLTTQSGNRQLEVWDTDDWRMVCNTFPLLSPDVRVWQSRDGNYLLGIEPISGATTNASRCRLWNFGSGEPVRDRITLLAPVDALAVDSRCQRVVAKVGQGAKVWDLNAVELGGVLLPHSNRVARAGFNPDGRSLFTVSGTAVHLWNATSGQPLCPPLTQRCGGSFVSIQAEFSPDGRYIVIGPADAVVEEKDARVWDAHTGQPVSPPLHHKDGVLLVAFSPDGFWVVTGSKDRTARLWDARSGRPMVPPMWHPGWVDYAEFSADSRRLVTSSLGTVRVWDTATGSPLTPPLRAGNGLGVSFFVSRGAAVAAVRNGEMLFWKLPCDNRPVKDWVATAHLLAGHQVDPTGVLAPVEPQVLSNAWAGLSVGYPSGFMAGSTSENPATLPSLRAIPPRDPRAGARLVDLSTNYNAALLSNWHGDVDENNLAELPTGVRRFDGVDFDVRCILQAPPAGRESPSGALTNIVVQQTCRRLHFLHAAINAGGLTNLTEVGRYIVHYEKGPDVEIPLRVGVELADWWHTPGASAPLAPEAWKGTNGKTMRTEGCHIRLFHLAWDNPQPGVTVRSIDLATTHNDARPFLVGLTLE
jgi:WD40 repeat protein